MYTNQNLLIYNTPACSNNNKNYEFYIDRTKNVTNKSPSTRRPFENLSFIYCDTYE